MHLDVTELRDFYYRSALGRAAQKVVRDELVKLWPEAKSQFVLGYGFAVPLLRPFLAEARRVVALMPAPQGVMAWPPGLPNVSVLSEPRLWPVATGAVDKLVVMHALEMTEHPAALLTECYRVLGPGGRAVFIVPNRAGLWSRSDATPFGYGRPYSLGQLERHLRDNGFTVETALSTLYQPPSTRRGWRRASAFLENAGRHLPVFAAGGVLMVEVSKQVPAPTRPGLPEAVRNPLRVLEGLGAAEPAKTGAPRGGAEG